MNNLARAAMLLLAVLLLVGAVLFFYPKERVVGGLRGGPIGPGESAYREDYTCLGIPYDYCPDWPDYGCDQLCFGLVTGQTCSFETYQPETGPVKSPTACQPGGSRWGFPRP